MKSKFLTILITAVVTASVTFIISRNFCGKATIEKNVSGNNDHQGRQYADSVLPPSSRAFSLPRAATDIAAFQNIISACGSPAPGTNSIVSYTISLQDIVYATGLQLPGSQWTSTYNYIRVYPGFDTSEGFKLFIVSVNEDDSCSGYCGTCGAGTDSLGLPKGGKDMFFDSLAVPTPNKTVGQGDYVLDLIAPCPTTCDTSSRLVQLVKNFVCCANCPQNGQSKTNKK